MKNLLYICGVFLNLVHVCTSKKDENTFLLFAQSLLELPLENR